MLRWICVHNFRLYIISRIQFIFAKMDIIIKMGIFIYFEFKEIIIYFFYDFEIVQV